MITEISRDDSHSKGGKLLYKFFASKEEKLTDKAFSHSLLVSVLSILFCLVALCSITYAWFVGETTSTGNTLVSGSFDLTITVTKDDTVFPVTDDANHDGVRLCRLNEAGTYTVNLEVKDGSSVQGHCLVKVGNGEFKHTDALSPESPADNGGAVFDTLSFSITVTEDTETVVVFEPRWGVVVEPDIKNGGVYPTPELSGTDTGSEAG